MKKYLLLLLLTIAAMVPTMAATYDVAFSYKDTNYKYYYSDGDASVSIRFESTDTEMSWIEYPSEVTLMNDSKLPVGTIIAGNQMPSRITQVRIPSSVTSIEGGAIDTESPVELYFYTSNTPLQYNISEQNKKLQVTKIYLDRPVEVLNPANVSNGGLFQSQYGCELFITDNVSRISGPFFNNLKVSRADFTDWDYWYNQTEVDCVEAVPYNTRSSDPELIIVAGGHFVTDVEFPEGMTAIPDYKNAGLTFTGTITLPSTLKRIGAYAFSYQPNLSKVIIPESVEEIGDKAFSFSPDIEIGALPSSLKKVGATAFEQNRTIKRLDLPETIEELGEYAFAVMDGLERAVLFSNLTELPQGVFSRCSNLTEVYLPQGLTSVPKEAFYECALREVVLPASVVSVGTAAFKSCPLSKVNFPAGLREIGPLAFVGSEFSTLELNEGLESIGAGAFSQNGNIRNVVLPSTLTTFGGDPEGWTSDIPVFSDNLNRIVIPDRVTTLTPVNATEIILGNGITEVESGYLGSPTLLTVGSGVTTFSNRALNFDNLKVMRMLAETPPTLDASFNLTEAQYAGVTFIVPYGKALDYKQHQYWGLFSVLEDTETEATVNVADRSITDEFLAQYEQTRTPASVLKMKVTGTLHDGDWTKIREGFTSLSTLDLSGIRNIMIPTDALRGMTTLSELILPSGTEAIGANAFKGNILMDIPSLPESIILIGEGAFADCSMLTITKLPRELESIGYAAFSGCTSITAIEGGEKLDYFETVASEQPGDRLFEGCTSLETVDFSSTSITTIGESTFSGCTSLTTVLLPESLEKIKGSAFANTSLEHIDLPASVKQIGASAFAGTKLRTIHIPEGVGQIEDKTFADCPKLLTVNFPGSLAFLGANVFQGSENVCVLSCASAEAPEADSEALSALDANRCSLTVPETSFSSYLSAPQWSDLASSHTNKISMSIDDGIGVTAISEDQYQAILEAEQLRAKTAGAVAHKSPGQTLSAGKHFARLFHQAQLSATASGSGTRIFIHPNAGETLKSVKFNDADLTAQMEDNSLLLPAGSAGTLKVQSDNDTTGIEESVAATEQGETCVAYDTTGRMVYSGERARFEYSVKPGVYIVRTGQAVTKVLVK